MRAHEVDIFGPHYRFLIDSNSHLGDNLTLIKLVREFATASFLSTEVLVGMDILRSGGERSA